MGRRALETAGLCATVLLTCARAFAQDAAAPLESVTLNGRNLMYASGDSMATLDLGCAGRATLRAESKLYVACGPDGVVEVDLSNPVAPALVGSMQVNGEATGLFLRDGHVWVEVAHLDARPVDMRSSGEAVGVASKPISAPAFVSPLAAADDGTPAGPPPPPKVSLMAPPRRGEIWELSASAGGYINLGPEAGGMTGWVAVVYRFKAPLVLRAELSSLGVAFGNSETVASSLPSGAHTALVGAGHVLIGLDTQFIEVAVGGGGATIGNSTVSGSTTGGASIVEEARFGARDGLAVDLESIAVAANNQFQFGSFAASVQVPLNPKLMMVMRGGGGGEGLLYGDLGVRVLVQGDGGRGSLALTGYFGGAGIDLTACPNAPQPQDGIGPLANCHTSLGGPSLGGGFEWRQ